MSKEILPVFPLTLVAYPGEIVNLHIFEPRYKQLIAEADAKNICFGIPTYIENQKLSYGTEVELVEIVEKYKDGKIDVRIKGQRVFEVLNFIPRMSGRLYSGADIRFLDIDRDIDYKKNRRILSLLSDLYQYLKMHKPLPNDEFSFETYTIGHFIGLSIKDELKLLGLAKESERQDFIIEHLQTIIPILKEMNALEKKIKMNGHFKNLIPPNM